MIHQEAPRKSLRSCPMPEDKGFWLDGVDRADCLRQLEEYGKAHPEKWIYFYACGMGPGYPIPVARNLFEVSIYNAEPASILLFSRLFQRGCEGRREVDEMSPEERTEVHKKQMAFFAMLGSTNNHSK